MLNPKYESNVSGLNYFTSSVNDDIFTADSLVSELTPDDSRMKLDPGLHS